MQVQIKGSPSFAYLDVELGPGETIIAESDAMATMAADLDLDAKLNGGCFGGVLRKFLGGESLFINHFTNKSQAVRHLTLAQGTPGDVRRLDLKGQSFCLQPGAYIASTPGVTLGLQYAGLTSFIAREGLFKLMVGGNGSVWFGAYGGLVEKQVKGEYIVDTSHLVAYAPDLKLKLQLAGGIFSSLLGGEGLVTRVVGNGTIYMQTRSVTGLAGWLNPRLY